MLGLGLPYIGKAVKLYEARPACSFRPCDIPLGLLWGQGQSLCDI